MIRAECRYVIFTFEIHEPTLLSTVHNPATLCIGIQSASAMFDLLVLPRRCTHAQCHRAPWPVHVPHWSAGVAPSYNACAPGHASRLSTVHSKRLPPEGYIYPPPSSRTDITQPTPTPIRPLAHRSSPVMDQLDPPPPTTYPHPRCLADKPLIAHGTHTPCSVRAPQPPPRRPSCPSGRLGACASERAPYVRTQALQQNSAGGEHPGQPVAVRPVAAGDTLQRPR